MANPNIVAELQSPATWGLNNVVRTYTNPGGAPKDTALAAISTNTLLFNLKDIDVYKDSISAQDYFSVLIASALQGLSSVERDDYQAFILPMLGNTIEHPEGLLRDLINQIFAGIGDNETIRVNYDAMIKEKQSIAHILELSQVRDGDIEQAMFELGWIV
jgi:hypothetical protein